MSKKVIQVPFFVQKPPPCWWYWEIPAELFVCGLSDASFTWHLSPSGCSWGGSLMGLTAPRGQLVASVGRVPGSASDCGVTITTSGVGGRVSCHSASAEDSGDLRLNLQPPKPLSPLSTFNESTRGQVMSFLWVLHPDQDSWKVQLHDWPHTHKHTDSSQRHRIRMTGRQPCFHSVGSKSVW